MIKEKVICEFEKISSKDWNDFLNKLKKSQIEIDLIDLNSLSKTDTTIEILERFILDTYGITLYNALDEIKNNQTKYDNLIKQELEKEEEKANEEFNEGINSIKLNTTEELTSAYKISNKLIKTLIKAENINGYILRGESGIGKSFSVSQQLVLMGMEKGKDFEILSSYTTPMSFYEFLYENRNKSVIILDDVSGFFDNTINQGMVLSALWGEGKKHTRIVKYNSGTTRLKIPKSFIFNAKLVWCINQIPRGLGIEAVKSRCFYYELIFNYQEKIKLMYEISKVKNISFEVMDFIKENCDESVENLDFRLLLKVYDIYKNNVDWKEIAIKLITRDENKYLLRKCLKESSTINEAQIKWSSLTNLTRRTFFRLKELTK